MDNIRVFGHDSLLIESLVDETEEQLQAYVTGVLIGIYGTLPEWLVFQFGRRYERGGKFYREFLCPAGSVDSRIQLRAGEPGRISRSLVIRGIRAGKPLCTMIDSGVEHEFCCNELLACEP